MEQKKIKKTRHLQRTFWTSVGDLKRMDREVNGWLAEMGTQGYDILSRDQISNDQGISVTYCLTQAGSESLQVVALQKQNKVLELAFRHKETLVDAVAAVEADGKAVTWEKLVEHLKGRRSVSKL